MKLWKGEGVEKPRKDGRERGRERDTCVRLKERERERQRELDCEWKGRWVLLA